MVNPKELIQFIAKAHRHTYAAPKETREKHRLKIPVLPGHVDYRFSDGAWSYHDSYAGQLRAPGREVVFFEDLPVWSMSYAGMIKDDFKNDAGEIYVFLRKALMNFDDSIPFRGPSSWREGSFEYTFLFEGDVAYFSGRESITRNGVEVFFQNVMASAVE